MSDDFDPARVTWVLDKRSFQNLQSAIHNCTEVVMDLETTGLAEHAWTGGPLNGGVQARIVLASLTLPTDESEVTGLADTWVVPLSHPASPFLGQWRAVMRLIAKTIQDAEKPFTNQNVGFDCKWVEACAGVDLADHIYWDTRQSSHLLDETISTRLKDRAPATFQVERWDDFDLTKPGAAERVEMFDLGMYAARDTYWTWRLARVHRQQMFLDGTGIEPNTPDEVVDARLGRLAYWVGMPMVRTMTRVEQRGIGLDVEWTQRELDIQNRMAEDLGHALAHRYDGLIGNPDPEDASFHSSSHWFQAWTKMAIEQGDLRVAAMTPTGQPSWGKAVLVRQARRGSEVAQNLLDVRSHGKKAEYLTSWLKHVTPQGRIHTTYYTARVVTGRLSSADPNMQQVTESLRPAFVPTEGYFIADLDYSQIELRIIAMISGCVPMIEAFRRGDDLHRILAGRITDKASSEVTPMERQAGKSANFGLAYGMSAEGFREYAETAYGVSFTMDEATLVRRMFFETWVGLEQWHIRSVYRATMTGEVVSPIGRVRRVPDIHSNNEKVVAYAERQAINSPVQGYASDLMQTAASSIEGMLPGHKPVEKARIVATVHDSLVVEVPQVGWRQAVAECVFKMLNLDRIVERLDAKLTVPLEVDVKVGTRWGLDDVAALKSSDLLGVS